LAINWKVGVLAQDAVWSGMYYTNGMAPGYNRGFAAVPQRQKGREQADCFPWEEGSKIASITSH